MNVFNKVNSSVRCQPETILPFGIWGLWNSRLERFWILCLSLANPTRQIWYVVQPIFFIKSFTWMQSPISCGLHMFISSCLFWEKSYSFKWGHFCGIIFKISQEYSLFSITTEEGLGFLVLQIIPQKLVALWKKLQRIYTMERREWNWSHSFIVVQGRNFLRFCWQSPKGRRTILILLVVVFRLDYLDSLLVRWVNRIISVIWWWFAFSLGSIMVKVYRGYLPTLSWMCL